MITTLQITPFGLTTHLLAIFKVTEANLPIFNLKYLTARIVITLIHALPSTDIPCNTNPLHCTSMIGSRSVVMAFKNEGTFGTLGVNNPFLYSLRINNTITHQLSNDDVYFLKSHILHHRIRTIIFRNWKVLESKPPPSVFFLFLLGLSPSP
jgi:hypothetical protein